MEASLITPVGSPLVKGIFGKGIMRVGRGATRAGTGYSNMNSMDEHF